MVGTFQNFYTQFIDTGNAVKSLIFEYCVVDPFPIFWPRIVLKTLASYKEQRADENNEF
jgi:hypothetical protein